MTLKYDINRYISNFLLNLDHGLEVITSHIEKTEFPWLMSNVVDNETGRPLGSGKKTHVIEHCGVKVGIMGLVEKEWLDTLPTIDPKEVTYTDFIKTGIKLATQLRKEVKLYNFFSIVLLNEMT